MALYDVKALAVHPQTGEIIGGPRVERIDTDTNPLFSHCRSQWDVEDAYEAFWNRLNHSWETDPPPGKEKVKVFSVERVALQPAWWATLSNGQQGSRHR